MPMDGDGTRMDDGCAVKAAPSWRDEAALADAPVSGGDERIVSDPETGLNRYSCAVLPMRGVLCLSPCAASPLSQAALEQVEVAHATFMTI